MAHIAKTTDGYRLELTSLEKIGAIHPDIDIPTTAIEAVRHVPNARAEVRGLRAPGTGLPGVIALGQWRTGRTKSFVAAYRDEPGYVIDLTGHRFDRIIVSTAPIPTLDQHLAPAEQARPAASEPTRAELYQQARERDIAGRSTMNKTELLAALSQA